MKISQGTEPHYWYLHPAQCQAIQAGRTLVNLPILPMSKIYKLAFYPLIKRNGLPAIPAGNTGASGAVGVTAPSVTQPKPGVTAS
jgi:hypothetical protein